MAGDNRGALRTRLIFLIAVALIIVPYVINAEDGNRIDVAVLFPPGRTACATEKHCCAPQLVYRTLYHSL